MSAQQTATLTHRQQQSLFPLPRSAEGSFTVFVDTHPLVIQTKTIEHNTAQGIFTITGRYAEAQGGGIREVHILIPDTTTAGTVFKMEEVEFTKTRVWYIVDTPTEKYPSRLMTGNLTIQQISPQGIHIAGACSGETDRNPSGKTHDLIINFDLST